jgi:excinuclease ABC subunit C
MENQLNSENIIKSLRISVMDTPNEPGVYIMKNGEGQIIYIGKAKSLKNRLKSYFSGGKDVKTTALLKHIRNIETIIVSSEYEALLLENTLIKQHSPKYNINLKDGKTYPVIRVTSEDFPRIFRTRRIIQDNSQYFGPFPNTHNVDIMLELIDKLFPLRKCKKIQIRKTDAGKAGKKNKPCMYYHIGRCMAPCCGKISIDDYNLHVEHVKKLLLGEKDSLIIGLASQMHEKARNLQFEQAAHIRNTIKAIESLTGEDSSVEDLNPEDRDYIAWAVHGVLAVITVFSVRSGKMTGRELFRTRSAADERESLEIFITSYYDSKRPPPPKIYFQLMNPGKIKTDQEACGKSFRNNLLGEWFKANFNYEPELVFPADKHHTAILAMAMQNAREELRKRLKERGTGPALEEIAKILGLKTPPQRIEGFDISHLEGKHPVASLISFKNGIPDKKNYRYFKLRSVIGVIDDYAAMREAVRRRYSRLIKEGTELPDLILVDGGVGQVNAAKGILDELGADCALAGLAKKNEEIWLPNAKEPIILSVQAEALKVLQFVRDECHRFANNFNRKLRSKDLFFSILQSVEGIGPKRAAQIIKVYETIANIVSANPKEMAERCRISEASARAVCACAKLSLNNH